MIIYLKTSWKYRKEIKLLNLYLSLLKENVRTINKEIWKGNRKDHFIDCYLIITNRMIIDIKSALELTKRGYYGSSYTLIAGMYRTLRMLLALHSEPNLLLNYLEEDSDTYQIDKEFSKQFSEGSLIKSINTKFGSETSQRSEMEKLLHGSGFVTRKYYAKRFINSEGLRAPELRFGAFYQETKIEGIINILQGMVLDNLGIFLEEHQTRKEHEKFKMVRGLYFMFLDKAGIKSSRS